MYGFTDTNQVPTGWLPAEALKINGEYLEYLVDGYRTLNVQGREAMSSEVETDTVGKRDGSIFLSRRYPERIITVRYQLVCASPQQFRESYNALAFALSVGMAELIFNDEPDKFYRGIPGKLEDVEPGRNAIVSTFELVCPDPYKYSVEEFEADVLSDGSLACDYNGDFPAAPVLTAQFYEQGGSNLSDAGDCGYVSFFTGDKENTQILQFGDPNETDGVSWTEAVQSTLFAQHLRASNAWTSTMASEYLVNNSAAVLNTGATAAGSIGMKSFSKNPGANTYYVAPLSYGSGSGWHGPTITRAINNAINFECFMGLKCCMGDEANATVQQGGFCIFLSDANGRKIAGVRVAKIWTGNQGRIQINCNNALVETIPIDFTYNNKYFGNKRSAGTKTVTVKVNGKTVKKKVAITAVNPNQVIRITKFGANITFEIGGIKRTYNVAALANTAITRISWQFQQYASVTPLTWIGLYQWKFIKHSNVTKYADIKNKFTTNDLLEVDCGDGSVKLNDNDRPDLGALGNDWEGFKLYPGQTQIGWSCSSWCVSPYRPTIGARWREVYL